MTEPQRKPFLYVVVCAAGIAGDVGKLIDAAHERSWDVGVVATPQGLPFLDVSEIEERTGYPRPGPGPRPRPPPAIAPPPRGAGGPGPRTARY
ncbi:hypothetical protein ACFXPW_10775, partial [Streptomyces goshikiensis]